ncbi:MAG: M66 family metalloprotease [Deinococcales bacterium]
MNRVMVWSTLVLSLLFLAACNRLEAYLPEEDIIHAEIVEVQQLWGQDSLALTAQGAKNQTAMAIGEIGSIRFRQLTTTKWLRVNLLGSYENPVIIMGGLSYRDRAKTTIRLKNVRSSSFLFQIDEWDYLDGVHATEILSYMVLDAGVYELSNGHQLEAGVMSLNQTFQHLDFQQRYSSQPILLSQVQSYNDASAVIVRQQVSIEGADLRVQEEQANDDSHAFETVGYVVFAEGQGETDGIRFAAYSPAQINHRRYQLNFPIGFSQSPYFMAALQSYADPDPATLRYRNLQPTGVVIQLEEEQSADPEVTHGNELLGYLAIELLPLTPIVEKLEFAQSHIIGPQGKTWQVPAKPDKTYELHLVGNREALLLVDFENTIINPEVEGFLNGHSLGRLGLQSPQSLPPTEAAGPAYSSSAYWVELPKTWLAPGLSLKFYQLGVASLEHAVNVGAPSVFKLYNLPFYLFGADESLIDFATASNMDRVSQEEFLAKTPIASLDAVNHPIGKIQWDYIIISPRNGQNAYQVNYKEQQQDGYAVMSAVLNILGELRNANGHGPTNNQYYGALIMANQDGSYGHPGGGLGGGHIGTGDHSYTGIFFHEQGHAFGMPHVGQSYAEGKFPYVGGSLAGSAWGYDVFRREFLAPFVPSTASRYANCASNTFYNGMPRQLDSEGRCVKQDPMQSGSGDQAAGYKYATFADFNAAVIQEYFEGLTTLNGSSHSYSGGRIVEDASSSTGFSRWDSLDKHYVEVPVQTSSGGLYGLDGGFYQQKDVLVDSIIITMSFAGTSDITQIYPPLRYRGNLMRVIDPTNPTELAQIVPNTGELLVFAELQVVIIPSSKL